LTNASNSIRISYLTTYVKTKTTPMTNSNSDLLG
jgi:hypothetical protein